MQNEDLNFDPTSFSGVARLFPLPNLVLFPHVMQPLHIFEPRYRAMVEEAVAGDHLITLATFSPGWEKGYEGRPPLKPIACLSRIRTHATRSAKRFGRLLQTDFAHAVRHARTS
jgi:Lon protease-like protein